MHSVLHSNSYWNMKYILRFRIIYIFKTMWLLKKELWEPHCTHALYLPAYSFWKYKMACLYRNHFRSPKLCKPLKQMGPLKHFFCCCPFPWKMHKTWWQRKKDCCICVFLVWHQRPMFFNKTPLINYLISLKGKLWCPLMLCVMNQGWKLSSQLTKDK